MNKRSCPRRKSERGQSIISVIVTALILMVVAGGVMDVLGTSFHTTRSVEPQSIGESAASNVQTDLSAMALYDPSAQNTLKHLAAGTKIVVTPATPAAANVYYPPSDTQPTTVVIQKVTPGANGAAVDLQTNVPGPGSSPASTLQSTISVVQGAPPKCDPSLPQGQVPGC